MSSDDEAQQQAQEPEVVPPTPPKLVEYDPVTGVPSEFNEFLPKDSEEYKRWKAAQEGDAAAAIAGLALALPARRSRREYLSARAARQ